jgi:hypoxanthine-DNA glycosylase
MPSIQSFPPIASRAAKVLILGSMPGKRSLAVGQYYANPHNVFWPIIGRLLAFDFSAPYAEKVAALKSARIALWDVLQSCSRDGSLDTNIDPDTEVANDFLAFFAKQKHITHVFFNGTKAESCFKRHVMRQLSSTNDFGNHAARQIHYCRLPSTSPAHATLSMAEKYQAWQKITVPLGGLPDCSNPG